MSRRFVITMWVIIAVSVAALIFGVGYGVRFNALTTPVVQAPGSAGFDYFVLPPTNEGRPYGDCFRGAEYQGYMIEEDCRQLWQGDQWTEDSLNANAP